MFVSRSSESPDLPPTHHVRNTHPHRDSREPLNVLLSRRISPSPEGNRKPNRSLRCCHPPQSETATAMRRNGDDLGDDSGTVDETATSVRRRQSRWDLHPSSSAYGTERKRKSRWDDGDAKPLIQLHGFVNGLYGDLSLDPEVQSLILRLLEISRLLGSALPVDDQQESARSPSPEPIYDTMGIQINTREFRARGRLNRERQEIISQLIKRNPAFKPPEDYRPPKLQKKIYIPIKEYPGYNFIGLIIGPRGNTQKRMEKETGAKISIRGKGSDRDGLFKLSHYPDIKPHPSDNDDLHVFLEAETQEALDKATKVIQKILQPVDDRLNEHKSQQLRELTLLRRALEPCRLCGKTVQWQCTCAARIEEVCEICGDSRHPTIGCPLKTTSKNMDGEYQSFCLDLDSGGRMRESGNSATTATLEITGSALHNTAWANGNSWSHSNTPLLNSSTKSGWTPDKSFDDTKLFILRLPPNIDEAGLIRLFAPFGEIVRVNLVKDKASGVCKYGFVDYSNAYQASLAIYAMNGCQVEGKALLVRMAKKNSEAAEGSGTLGSKSPTVGSNFPGANHNSYSSSWPLPSHSGFTSSFPGADPDKCSSSQSFGPSSGSGSSFPGTDPYTYSSSQSFSLSNPPYMPWGSSVPLANTEPASFHRTQYHGTTYPHSSESTTTLTSLRDGSDTSQGFPYRELSTLSVTHPTYAGGLPAPSGCHTYHGVPPRANVDSGDTLKTIIWPTAIPFRSSEWNEDRGSECEKFVGR